MLNLKGSCRLGAARRASCVLLPVLALVSASALPQSDYPLQFKDSQDRSISLASPPQRIVSLNPGNTEILLALDAAHLLVGVDQYSARTGEAREIQQVGPLLTPSYEEIIALRPDLVLMSGMSIQHLEKLESLGLNVAMTDPHHLEGMFKMIAFLGRIAGRREQAGQIESELRGRMEAVQRGLRHGGGLVPKVFVEIWPEPLRSAGPGTFFSELIELAGGRNIADDAVSEWPLFSLETLVARDPDIILTSYRKSVDELLSDQRSQWRAIKAVRDGRVYFIDPDEFSRPGPRLIDTLERIADLFHGAESQEGRGGSTDNASVARRDPP